MKFRTEFVTNSSSSSYVYVTLATNKKSYDIDNEYLGDPGWPSFYPLGGRSEIRDYGELLEYVILVKLRELAKENNFELLEIDASGGYHFLKDNYPDDPNDLEKRIKYLVDLDSSNIQINSYDEFTQLAIWVDAFDFDDDEKLIEITESNRISVGEPESEPTTYTEIDVETLNQKAYDDYSDAIEYYLESDYFFKWEEMDEYISHESYEKIIRHRYDASAINDLKCFYCEIVRLLDESLGMANDEYTSITEQLLEFATPIEDHSFKPQDLEEISEIIQLGNSLVEQANELDIDLSEIVENALNCLDEKRRVDALRHTEKYEGKSITTAGRFQSKTNLYLSQDEVIAMIEQMGGKYVRSIDEAQLLIVGDDAGKKHQKAIELGLPILDGKIFMEDYNLYSELR